MTRETAEFLLGLLGGLTLNAGADDFDQAVAAIQKARAELLAEIGDTAR